MRCEKSSQRPNHIGHYEIKRNPHISVKGSHDNILNDEVTGYSMSKILFGIKSLNLKVD